MKRNLLLLFLFLSVALVAEANVPVRRVMTHRQSDGTLLTYRYEGNGLYVSYSTLDGISLLRGADKHFYYAALRDGEAVPTATLAHDEALRSEGEQTFLAEQAVQADELAEFMQQKTALKSINPKGFTPATTDGLGKYGLSANGSVKSIGAPVIPVVMAEFTDRHFQDTTTIEKVSRFFNEEGYADESYSKGSVADYYKQMSNGLFTPTFKVVAKVRLSQPYAYYGADASSTSIDTNYKEFVKEVLDSASKTVNFAEFATAGKVPMVSVMYAGPGQHSSREDGYEDYLWARFSSGTSFSVNDGAVTVSSFFLGDELFQNYNINDDGGYVPISANFDGIGLFCHEFSHALGLPDLYYTGKNTTISKTIRTMGYWDLMDYGQYMYNGYYPPAYSAYERSFLGWLDIKELTDPEFVTLYPSGSEDLGPTACVIRNPENEKEYYIFQNRQDRTWYHANFLGHGLLVTHVDYSASLWTSNSVNNDPDHRRVMYVPADNGYNLTYRQSGESSTDFWNTYRNDLFPGGLGVKDFTDTTTPSADVFTPSGKLGAPVYGITEHADGTITFAFLEKSLTGVQGVTTEENGTATEVYGINGRRLPGLQGAAPGVYIVRQGDTVRKVLVK